MDNEPTRADDGDIIPHHEEATMWSHFVRTRWAAIGAAVAVTLGAGGIGITEATTGTGERPIYVPIEPCRLADLRPAPDTVGPRSAALGPAEVYKLSGWGDVGNCMLPNGTTGLSLNVTAVGQTELTFITFYPGSGSLPLASHLNPSPGEPPTPNAVNVDLDAAGEFNVYNLQGNVSVIIDVVGYYDHHHHDDRYYTESETYTKAEVDAAIGALPETHWAVVNGSTSAVIARQSGGITLSYAGVGNAYFLTFPRDVSSCGWVVSLGGWSFLDSVLPVLNDYGISTNAVFGTPERIGVSVYDDAGALVTNAFTVHMTCP
ncbi:MAG: hypothetical protein QNJ12_19125 [Ilumatobacter sp.]|uniref:hypothetical protein n=1 Tax=Ilumatobacter sp. TaxID=1967498 RepID=UPI00262C4C32|nr:hypothetical protein [Ilumatobacter sp.]MDJ0770914.1 hypothetical protein [Ilumatobacter sp.]